MLFGRDRSSLMVAVLFTEGFRYDDKDSIQRWERKEHRAHSTSPHGRVPPRGRKRQLQLLGDGRFGHLVFALEFKLQIQEAEEVLRLMMPTDARLRSPAGDRRRYGSFWARASSASLSGRMERGPGPSHDFAHGVLRPLGAWDGGQHWCRLGRRDAH